MTLLEFMSRVEEDREQQDTKERDAIQEKLRLQAQADEYWVELAMEQKLLESKATRFRQLQEVETAIQARAASNREKDRQRSDTLHQLQWDLIQAEYEDSEEESESDPLLAPQFGEEPVASHVEQWLERTPDKPEDPAEDSSLSYLCRRHYKWHRLR